ncbi:MAG TPA: zinc-binding dehydrogenase [Aggregatilineales bacterium]|nr:zinc-binding dehydrogenase [Aggregatilineales bacterium]
MRAVVFDNPGPADVLHLVEDYPVPEPGEGEVRVRVRAAALNRLDIWVRNGLPNSKLKMPHITGADAAGDVDKVGRGVSDWQPGQRVVVDPGLSCGHCDFCRSAQENLCAEFKLLGEDTTGTYAEYIVVPARNLLLLPEQISYAEGAGAALVFLTAWHSLITKGNLRPGETVLIVGAGGGVNSASIQIAKLAGAKVFVVGSNQHKLEQAKTLGADELIDRSVEDWSKAVFTRTGKRGVDVVVDNVGKETLFGSIRAVRRGGRILIVGNTSGPQAEIDLRYIFRKHISIIGSTMAPHADFATVMRLVFEGKLKSIVGATFPLAQAAEAHRVLEKGEVFGKVVLEIP